jgi:Methyltransferase domain
MEQRLSARLAADMVGNFVRQALRNTALGEWKYRVSERTRNELREEFLRRTIPANGVGAELGVFKGTFTRTLLETTRAKKLYIVDPWHRLGARWDWAAGDRSTINALRRILHEHRDNLVTGRLELVIDTDLAFLERLEDGALDWAYVDTTHEYEQTKAELDLLQRKVKPDGVIAGDDWQPNPSHRHHGVCRAVREFVAMRPFELFYSSENDFQWAIRSTTRLTGLPRAPTSALWSAGQA